MADYSALVASLDKVTEIKGKIWPIKRPEKATGIPACVYTPSGGDNIESMDGYRVFQSVSLDLFCPTFETLNRVQDQVLKVLWDDGVIAQAPDGSFQRFDDDLLNGIFISTTDVVLSR